MRDCRAIFLMGPTGAGKTRAALAIAQRIGAEIISVDSALVFRGLDIGTAKPNPAERRAVMHHLVDIRDPDGRYSAAEFRADALAAMAAIRARGRRPLLVGGTGLYFRSLDEGLAALPPSDPGVREALYQRLEAAGPAALHRALAKVDPEAAARIHENDPQRLVRALEVHQLSGRPISALWREGGLAGLAEQPLKLVLAPADRTVLHAAIEARFLDMLDRGLENELQALRRRYQLDAAMPAMRSVGYRQMWEFLEGRLSRAAMIKKGIVATRQLAKRQFTCSGARPDASGSTAIQPVG